MSKEESLKSKILLGTLSFFNDLAAKHAARGINKLLPTERVDAIKEVVKEFEGDTPPNRHKAMSGAFQASLVDSVNITSEEEVPLLLEAHRKLEDYKA